MSSDLGESQNFPIINPVTDEFYNYSANNANQSSWLFDGFIGAEWTLWPNWLVQGGLGYNQATPFKARGILVQGADSISANTYSYQYGVLARQLLIEGKLLYTVKDYFHPYVLLGLGASFNRAYHYSTSVPPFLTFTRQYASHTETSFSYALGFGIDTEIVNNVRVGVGYRFVDLGQISFRQCDY